MKLGVLVETEDGLTWDRWRRIVAAVERLGFESLWLSDHFLSLSSSERESLECWVALTVAAAETTRVRLGPLVSPMTFRPPALLARMAVAVDHLSGGRLVLGVGAGWNDVEHRAYGIPYPPARERLDLLAEGIEVIRRLCEEGPAHYVGRYYQLDGADLQPKPRQRPRLPLLIGGMGERRTLPLVARYADEWNLTTADPALYRAKSERLAACCREIGRDPATIARSVAVGLLVGRDAAELGARCEVLRRLLPRLAPLSLGEIPEAMRAVGWVVGTPAEVAAQLRALAAAGVERAMLQLTDQTDLAALELVAHEVMPELH
ncbi:MAG TPA: TIGR03560 family F420-dependent LLM class oxidoreductase [Chloroflexota bacterium]|nr:TIGR03560 family F420-dependent LLM class oxidoreductase [Chloroflexota bacterium]